MGLGCRSPVTCPPLQVQTEPSPGDRTLPMPVSIHRVSHKPGLLPALRSGPPPSQARTNATKASESLLGSTLDTSALREGLARPCHVSRPNWSLPIWPLSRGTSHNFLYMPENSPPNKGYLHPLGEVTGKAQGARRSRSSCGGPDTAPLLLPTHPLPSSSPGLRPVTSIPLRQSTLA